VVGFFIPLPQLNPMAAIDITAMSGELPRVVAHMLPQSASCFAQDCHFRHGVITPVLWATTFKHHTTTRICSISDPPIDITFCYKQSL